MGSNGSSAVSKEVCPWQPCFGRSGTRDASFETGCSGYNQGARIRLNGLSELINIGRNK